MISGLICAFIDNVAAEPEHLRRRQAAGRGPASAPAAASSPPTRSRQRPTELGVDEASTDALVEDYEDAQLNALKTAFLFAALLTLGALLASAKLPTQRFDELQSGPDPPAAAGEPEPQPA